MYREEGERSRSLGIAYFWICTYSTVAFTHGMSFVPENPLPLPPIQSVLFDAGPRPMSDNVQLLEAAGSVAPRYVPAELDHKRMHRVSKEENEGMLLCTESRTQTTAPYSPSDLSQCDGCQPCRRCVSRGEDCVYEDKMWQTKDHLRSEIARLRREVQQCHGLIEALTGGSTAEGWRTIQSFMRRGDSPEQIAAWINTSRSPSGILGAGVSPEQAEQQTVSPGSSSHSIIPESCGPPKTSSRPYPSASSDTAISAQSSSEDGHVSTAPDAVSPAASDALCCLAAYASSGTRTTFLLDGHVSTIPRSLSSWAGLTQDTELLYSLLQHYFDNCFPNYSFICKERFMMDVDEKTGMYCSSALLHAILGFASQSYSPSSDIASDSGQSSRFLAQAKELLSTGKGGISITDIQATGVLALAEANRGNDAAAMESANDCVRKAVVWKIKMASGGVRTEDPGYREAMAATFCGAISLARYVCFQLPRPVLFFPGLA